ncbi:MAG TPA: hypothetical protein PLJ91_04715, partial [Thermomonas sp.]|nr:hypothetical protein [Thermomonas sp.]
MSAGQACKPAGVPRWTETIPDRSSAMIRFQMQMRKTASLAVVVAALSACGNTSTTAPADTASGMQAAVEQAEGDAQAAGAASTGDAPLKPGQTIQGSIEADVGNGTQSFRSLATKVADDIGAQVEGKLDTGKGQRAIDDANRKLEKLGVESRVGADDVREMVEGMAGKTFHDASVMQVDIIKSLQVSLKGTASDGAQVDLAMTFDDKSLALTSSNFSYRPKANAMFDFYQSKGDKDVEVTLERFERNADGTYALTGTFAAKDLPASKMAKKLPSASL